MPSSRGRACPIDRQRDDGQEGAVCAGEPGAARRGVAPGLSRRLCEQRATAGARRCASPSRRRSDSRWMPLDPFDAPGVAQVVNERMSKIKPAGTSATVKAAVSMEVAQLAIECIQPTPACYAAVGRSLNADRLMWAEVEPGADDDKLRLTVVLFDVQAGTAPKRVGGPSPMCRRRVPARRISSTAPRMAGADRHERKRLPEVRKDSVGRDHPGRPVRSAPHRSSGRPRARSMRRPRRTRATRRSGEPGGQGERDAAAQPQDRRRLAALTGGGRRRPASRRPRPASSRGAWAHAGVDRVARKASARRWSALPSRRADCRSAARPRCRPVRAVATAARSARSDGRRCASVRHRRRPPRHPHGRDASGTPAHRAPLPGSVPLAPVPPARPARLGIARRRAAADRRRALRRRSRICRRRRRRSRRT